MYVSFENRYTEKEEVLKIIQSFSNAPTKLKEDVTKIENTVFVDMFKISFYYCYESLKDKEGEEFNATFYFSVYLNEKEKRYIIEYDSEKSFLSDFFSDTYLRLIEHTPYILFATSIDFPLENDEIVDKKIKEIMTELHQELSKNILEKTN